mgnify:CR=1 FL=1
MADTGVAVCTPGTRWQKRLRRSGRDHPFEGSRGGERLASREKNRPQLAAGIARRLVLKRMCDKAGHAFVRLKMTSPKVFIRAETRGVPTGKCCNKVHTVGTARYQKNPMPLYAQCASALYGLAAGLHEWRVACLDFAAQDAPMRRVCASIPAQLLLCGAMRCMWCWHRGCLHGSTGGCQQGATRGCQQEGVVKR